MHSARHPPCSYTVLVALLKKYTTIPILIAFWFRSPVSNYLGFAKTLSLPDIVSLDS